MKINNKLIVASLNRQINAFGFRSFIEAAETHLKIMDPESADHAILKYLLENAVGAENAKCWKAISKYLDKKGFKVSENNFQNNLLKRSRRSLYYIGSSYSGFFLFGKPGDVEVTCNFYKQRIGGEVANWDTLVYLAPKANLMKEPSDTDDGEGRDAA